MTVKADNELFGSLSAAVDEALCKTSDKRKHGTRYIILQTDNTLHNSCFLCKRYLTNIIRQLTEMD